jgi:hypothetical protein
VTPKNQNPEHLFSILAPFSASRSESPGGGQLRQRSTGQNLHIVRMSLIARMVFIDNAPQS